LNIERFYFPPLYTQLPSRKVVWKMDNIPSLIFCGLSATFSFDDESKEDSSIMDLFNPLCCRDQGVETIFRPMTNKEFAERDEWSPPLYRDKSLLSSPSNLREASKVSPHPSSRVDVVPYDHTPSPKRNVNDDTHLNEHCDDFLNPIPSEFLPPRHSFSKTFDERDERCQTSKARNVTNSLPSETRVDELKPTDVLCGRGMLTSIHPGNVAYKRVIKKHEMEYICSKRSVKPKLAMKLLKQFRRNAIRFVKRERDANDKYIWIDIGDERAYQKVSQSLREGAPQLRRQMLSSQAFQHRQDSDTNKSMSMVSSTREGDERNQNMGVSWVKASSSNTMPLYHSDLIPDVRFKEMHNYYPNPNNIMYHPSPPTRNGSNRYLVE
jgi:hypothetical protein